MDQTITNQLRTQKVVLDGEASSIVHAESGVPEDIVFGVVNVPAI